MHPIAPRLVELIRESAPCFEARDAAPSSAPELLGPGLLVARMPVWSGASEATIHGAPSANWAFRAWHDSIHVETRLGFTPAEELEVARIQAARVAAASGDRLALLVWLEVAGQALEYARTGNFVADQVGWTLNQLKRMGVHP